MFLVLDRLSKAQSFSIASLPHFSLASENQHGDRIDLHVWVSGSVGAALK